MSQPVWLKGKHAVQTAHCGVVDKLMMSLLLMVMMVMTIRKILLVPFEEGRLASRCSNRRGFPV